MRDSEAASRRSVNALCGVRVSDLRPTPVRQVESHRSLTAE